MRQGLKACVAGAVVTVAAPTLAHDCGRDASFNALASDDCGAAVWHHLNADGWPMREESLADRRAEVAVNQLEYAADASSDVAHVSAVPEPSTSALLAAGAGAVVLLLRRRRRR